MSVLSFFTTQMSTLLPDPKSCIIPASTASITIYLASSSVKSSLYLVSKIAEAAMLPLPIVQNG